MKQDRLSNLPIIIRHDILSRLPVEDAARTSVLSKDWSETWFTLPILSFFDTKIIGEKTINFIESDDYLWKRKKFLDYVERTLLKLCEQKLAIKKFKLNVRCFDLHNLSKDVDHWLKQACERGVEVLDLWQDFVELNEHELNDQCYILPMDVLEAKSLTQLVLTRRIGVDLSFMNNRSFHFFSLQVLSFVDVLLGDEQAFKNLISRCHLIEYIILLRCYVLIPGGEWRLHDTRNSQMKSLSLCGLPKLKGVHVEGIQELYVDSRCLENFYYCPTSPKEPIKIDFSRCGNLRWLSLRDLESTIITNKWFCELFRKFPFLESLELENCQISERINISSDKLKVFELSYCSSWKEVNIDAPNLLSCVYDVWRATNYNISFLRCSSQLEVDISITISHVDFYYLREFIQNLKSQSVLASIFLYMGWPFDAALIPFVLQDSSLPPRIKHLQLAYAPKDESMYFPFVHGLLSSCCPTKISMRLDSLFCSREFIEFFYETLMGKNKNKWCCSSGHSKCWWLRLKGLKVTSSMTKIGDNVDVKTVLDVLQSSEAQADISFWLEF